MGEEVVSSLVTLNNSACHIKEGVSKKAMYLLRVEKMTKKD